MSSMIIEADELVIPHTTEEIDRNTLSYRLKYAMRFFSVNQSELARRIGVKPQVIQYLVAGNVKSSKFSYEIADALEINYSWLAAGEGEMVTCAHENIDTYKIPFLNWEDLNLYYENKDLHVTNSMFFNIYKNDSCFSLKLNDDSLKPRFENGSTLVFDRSIKPRDNDFVLARVAKSDKWLVRLLNIENNKKILLPINIDIYKTIELDFNDLIFGVMVQAIYNVKRE